MISFTKEIGRIKITLSAIRMGQDWSVVITGGDRPHLGAAALGIPRPSLKNPEKSSASVSVLTVTGHKDDEIAREAAHQLATRLNCIVLVACGIHMDKIMYDELVQVQALVDDLLAQSAPHMLGNE